MLTATGDGLAVCAQSPVELALAEQLSARLALPLLPEETSPEACEGYRAMLIVTADGLVLQQTGRKAPGPVSVDFGGSAMRHRRRGGHNELLGKAVGVGRKPSLHVVDGTAGLGRDAFVLADLGCHVVLCEREPVLAVMLESALARAIASPDEWLSGVARRMSLLEGDATRQAPDTLPRTDVVYLDPMFPHRDKQAAVKKEMALFQHILPATADDRDNPALLDWALSLAPARVVVKRARKAPTLDQRQPSHVISGKSVRFDVYVQRGLG